MNLLLQILNIIFLSGCRVGYYHPASKHFTKVGLEWLFASLRIKKQVQNPAQTVLLIPTHSHIALKPKYWAMIVKL